VDNPRRYPNGNSIGRNIFGNDGFAADHGAGPDGDARKHGNMAAKPGAVADGNRRVGVGLVHNCLPGGHAVIRALDVRVTGDQHFFPDGDVRAAVDDCTDADTRALPDTEGGVVGRNEADIVVQPAAVANNYFSSLAVAQIDFAHELDAFAQAYVLRAAGDGHARGTADL